MAGHAAAGQRLSEPSAVIARGGPGDEPELRRILREIPMKGAISLSFEREPDFFRAAAMEGDQLDVVVARAGERVVGFGTVTVRPLWVHGQPLRVGYMSMLRVERAHRGGALTSEGIRLCQSFRRAEQAPWFMTVVVADNLRARAALREDRPGFPRFRELAGLCTLILPTWKARGAPGPWTPRPATGEDLDGIVACLERSGRRRLLAPVFTAEDLLSQERCPGLSVEDFTVVEADGRVVACVAVWNQGALKQSVVRGYAGVLKWSRPAVNLVAPIVGIPRLPPVGEAIPSAHLSHLAVDEDDAELSLAVLGAAYDRARAGPFSYLTLGLPGDDPRLDGLRRHFGAREYRSVVMTVSWEDGHAAADALQGAGVVYPEVAVL